MVNYIEVTKMRLAFCLLTGLFLSVLAGDLLYLHYAGAWYDPIRWIEILEVILLYILFVWGIVLAVISYRGIK